MSADYRSLILLGVAAVALSSSGCLAVAAGCAGGAAVGYAYVQGRDCQLYAASPDDTWAAARTALADLGMAILEEKREGGKGFLRSQTRDGDAVRIHLLAEASKFPADGPQTRVCIRVGLFGDHPASIRIFDQIALHLTPAAPAGMPPLAPSTGSAVLPPPPPPSLPPPTPAPPLLKPEPVAPVRP